MKLYNSLSRKVEDFKPIEDKKVGMYTCGPTVYDYLTVGNWRTYTLGDVLYRSLVYLGYDVTYIMNITDVGHLTGDNLGDADLGEDRMEKAAKREGKSAWEIAEFYTQDFLKGFDELNLIRPERFTKATEHIDEQIAMVEAIEKAGFSYETSDGIYFDVAAYEKAGHDYGKLSTLDELKEGARVEPNPEKKDPRDFALWKLSPENEERQMEWESPWGMGFPGWHIECSAMSTKYLGERFDIHVGGEDLRSTHHPNEVAQAETATGKKPFVKYWVHGAFLLVDGGRMGKSLGNAYTLHDVSERGYTPMALRYFYLTGHYRKQLNFTWEALEAAQNRLFHLEDLVSELKYVGRTSQEVVSDDDREQVYRWQEDFEAALERDLNLPQALAVVADFVKVARELVPDQLVLEKLLEWDSVLGLNLESVKALEIPQAVQQLVEKREEMRKKQEFESADTLRAEIEELGYVVEDTEEGSVLRKKRE